MTILADEFRNFNFCYKPHLSLHKEAISLSSDLFDGVEFRWELGMLETPVKHFIRCSYNLILYLSKSGTFFRTWGKLHAVLLQKTTMLYVERKQVRAIIWAHMFSSWNTQAG